MLKKFLKSEKGNFAFLFSLFLVPIFFLATVSLDFSRALRSETKLQAIADAAALAGIAVGGTKLEAELIANEYLHRNVLAAGLYNKALTASIIVKDPPTGPRTVQVLMGSEVPMTFAKLLHLSNIQLKADAIATRGSSTQNIQFKKDIEITFAWSINRTMGRSLAMNGVVKKIFNRLYASPGNANKLTVSLIPFSKGVAFGDPYKPYLIASAVQNVRWGVWNGCFDFHSSSLKNEIFSEKRLSLNSYDIYRGSATWRDRGCPGAEILPLQNDNKKIQKYIRHNAMTTVLGYRPAPEMGMAVAFKSLSPVWRGHFDGGIPGKPANYSKNVTKIIIFMSDGVDPTHGSIERKQFLKVCTAAKSKGIEIYTLRVLMNSGVHKEFVKSLKACASSPKHHIDVPIRPNGYPKIYDTFSTIIDSYGTAGGGAVRLIH